MVRNSGWVCFAVLAALTSLALPAAAQQAPSDADQTAAAAPTATGPGIEEITVTARRRVESVQAVPLSVTSLSGEGLKLNSVQDLEDIEEAAPGIRINVFGARTSTAGIIMRGQSAGSDVATVDGAVGVYINEVYIGKEKGLNQQLFDIERVEVLRGPQGTYFGRNTTGGALLVTTAEPEEDFGGYLTAHFGEFSRYGGEGAVNLPISDTLLSRVAFSVIRRNGFSRRCVGSPGFGPASFSNPFLIGEALPNPAEVDGTNCPKRDYQDLDDENANGWRVSLSWAPRDNFNTKLIHDGFVSNNNGTASFISRVIQADPSAYPSVTIPQLLPFLPILGGISPALGSPIGAAAAACTGAFGPGAPLTAITGVITAATPSNGLADCLWEGRPFASWQMTNDLRGSQRQSASATKQLGRIRNYGVVSTSEADLEAFVAKLIFGYRYVKVNENFDLDGTTDEILFTNQRFDQRQVSGEVLFQGTAWDERIDWTTGVYVFKEWGNDGSTSPLLRRIGQTDTRFDADFEHKAYSLFGQVDYEFIPKWTLTGGFRYSWDKRQMIAKHRSLNAFTGAIGCAITDDFGVPRETPGNPLLCREDLRKTFSEPSWEAKLSWQATDELLWYLTHRRGYRSGGFNLRAQNDTQFRPFNQELVTDVETGVKSDFELGPVPVRTNLAFYYSWYDDAQRSQIIISPTGALQTVIVNAASAEIWGGEFEVRADPFDSLELRVNTTITHARYTKYSEPYDSSPAPGPQIAIWDRKNDRFVQPDYAVSASARYTLPIDTLGGRPSGEIALQVSMTWVDETVLYNPQLPTTSGLTFTRVFQDPYTVVNVRADWTNVMGLPFDFSIFVKNLADEEYTVATVPFQNSFGLDVDNWGPPRLWAGTITYHF